ncbi:MAG: primosomal protein N' [Bacteroides sp.]|nr:primosomal protein N' [Bacteroides sp.]MCM1379758.1 primosomal protein N' [Bacteroides sp.]MCM1445701.1 primosomal protein N' [Prevotella sp.]
MPLNAVFTYSVPDRYQRLIHIGSRVVVPFGRRKFYTGIICNLTAAEPIGYQVKDIERILDPENEPILVHPQLKFWQWIADYYLCTVGDVMRAALPSALKLESETFIEIAADCDLTDREGLSDEEAILLQTLSHNGKLSVGDLVKKSGLSAHPEQLITRLIDRGLLMVSEKILERYRTQKQAVVVLPETSNQSGWRAMAFAKVRGAAKQERLLLTALQLAGKNHEIDKTELLEKSGCSVAILKALADKQIIKVEKREVNRFAPKEGMQLNPLPTLSEAQKKAVDEIISSWIDEQKAVTLLRGVTSSGKTEVYIHLMSRMLKQKKQILMLVPEIALTTQLTERLQRVFGSKVIVYHSKFTDNERVDIWKRLRGSSEPCIVIGARSSVFLPFQNLGLVIIDEEHEPSYKQFDPAPRYNARDCAILLASMHGAKTLLGSASPAVETYYKAKSGRYGLVELTERYGGVKLPEIEIVDMKREWEKTWSDSPFASSVKSQIQQSVTEGNQAIVFHNRRGFAPMARCRHCAYVPKCEHCDVSLTYHRRENKLICHYCGSEYELPKICPVCGEPAIEVVGFGTEKIEELIEKELPSQKILRMDLDTTRNKDGYQEIINAFSAHKADILVGTQMVTKGLDFNDVNVVAVLSSDSLINLPDFRASERAFNMLLQVAGRAGRRETSGKVIIQAGETNHPVIEYVKAHDYTGFYEHEIAEREQHFYPPFSRMVFIYLKHKDEDILQSVAEQYGARLRALLGSRVNGPDKPAVSRIQSMYIRRFMLKIEVGASMQKVKMILRNLFEEMHKQNLMHSTVIYYDVDPA